ncbi:MAG: hypothetical protein FWE32_07030 [Oscillospiraceae bacterium]|nr:hypothetical protein [Oscillospiraceae bacterium]
MNVIELAKELLDKQAFQELNSAIRLLEEKEYENAYHAYGNMINNLVSLSSYSEFIDFFNKSSMNESVFALGFLYEKNKCIEIGGYEQSVQNKIKPFIESHGFVLNIHEDEIFTDFDGDDNFQEHLSEINQGLKPMGAKLVTFFNDIYYACTYTLFLLNNDFAEVIAQRWSDETVELLNSRGKFQFEEE